MVIQLLQVGPLGASLQLSGQEPGEQTEDQQGGRHQPLIEADHGDGSNAESLNIL